MNLSYKFKINALRTCLSNYNNFYIITINIITISSC